MSISTTMQTTSKESMKPKITDPSEERCDTCQGIGLEKREVIVCDKCNGKKCMFCNSSGLSQHPYETCRKCFGSGQSL